MTRVLATDDSASMRQMVAFVLQGEGFEVVSAEDGVDALEKARAGEFDLAITDVNMPRMGGIELIGELRKLPAWRFTPLLVLTTESSQALRDAGRTAGATGWLVKPFDPDEFLAVVRRVLD